ncbi:MAG: hypothetical protein LBD22_03130 [Spirochaetaceae bacterium]|jgi:hypothetical protein|nr:hypothetical protein [Spirochaetaceae bacterium]
MKRLLIQRLIVLCLVVLVCSGCPVMEAAPTIPASGIVRLDTPIAQLNYEVKKIHIYTRHGDPITSIVPEVIYLPAPVPTPGNPAPMPLVDYINWKLDINAPAGSFITLWVEFLDPLTQTVYFGQAQGDILTPGNLYEWKITGLYVPIFSQKELALIGKDLRFLASGKYVLVSDIQLTNTWTPICNTLPAFTGTFDGNERTISGLKFNADDSIYVGLFGRADNASFKNLSIVLDGALQNLGAPHTQHYGGLVGYALDTEITRVSVMHDSQGGNTPLHIAKSGGTEFNIGGIVGSLAGTVSKITQSSFHAPLSITIVFDSSQLLIDAGGVVGKAGGRTLSGSTAGDIVVFSMMQCYAAYDIGVSVFGMPPSTDVCTVRVGGLVGGATNQTSRSSVRIEESYFGGNISVQSAGIGAVGGIFGGGASALSATNSILTILRSVSFANMVDVAFGTSTNVCGVDRIAGQLITTPALPGVTNRNFALVPVSYNGIVPPGTIPTPTGGLEYGSGSDQDRAMVTGVWFSNQGMYGGLDWDFNSVWVWDGTKGRPVFQWQ